MVQSPPSVSRVKQRSRFAGFTILEVTIALGLAGVLSTVVFPTVLNYRSQSDLNVAVSTVVQGLGSARIFAQSNKHDSVWGFRVAEGVLFEGSSYAGRNTSSDVSFPLPPSITPSGLKEAIFTQISGKVVQGGVILLTARNGLQAAIVLDGDGIEVVSVTQDIIDIAHSIDSSIPPVSSSSTPDTVPSSSDVTTSTSQAASDVTQSSVATQSAGTSVGTDNSASASSLASSDADSSTQSSVSVHSINNDTESSTATSQEDTSVQSSASNEASASGNQSSAANSESITPIDWQRQSIGILVLDPTAQGALSLTGNGSMLITNTNATVVVDSDNASAIWMSGSSKITATSINIAGDPGIYKVWNAKVVGTVHPGMAPTGDPLTDVPALSPPTQTFSAAQIGGNSTVTINPGTYIGGIKVSANAHVTLNPGIYYLQGGGLSISGNAVVSGRGVMIYNAPAKSTDKISISGNANLTLSPIASGIYAGISMYQSKASTVTMSISGNGTLNIDGVLYIANALLDISGNGNVNLQCLSSSRFIVKQLRFSGNGTFNVQ